MRWMLPTLLLAACNPYNRVGDYYAGAIDPSDFPSAYTGVGFDSHSSQGEIRPVFAFTASATMQGPEPVGYFFFPVPDGVNPLILRQIVNNITQDKPLAYVFDGDDANDTSKCTPPSKDYVYDEATDFARFDRQGNIFQQRQVTTGPRRDPASLPSDPGYVPIYAQVPVSSNGEDCQSLKSGEGIVAAATIDFPDGKAGAPPGNDTHPVGIPDGQYLAFAIIDPAANVWGTVSDGTSITLVQNPNTLLGPQRFGFFDHYLVAYIEGGYVPATPIMASDGTVSSIVANPMTLYVPNTVADKNSGSPIVYFDPRSTISETNNPLIPIQNGAPGVIVGSDGKSGTRGQPGYSPICQVHTYTPADAKNLPTTVAQITPLMVDPEAGGATFIYCLQVAQ